MINQIRSGFGRLLVEFCLELYRLFAIFLAVFVIRIGDKLSYYGFLWLFCWKILLLI